ncbi:MAG: bifunctional 3,4-dihydroxy-2-butanone 4-phosphate synthase/GTP cyclohydrolase II [Bacteroidetes bacterium RIFCSPLOWO2_12_FULL_37_12]|nr:MAG: bifunctional 3,4-dihydroxy-2-butanone 4-phosphate synthase/GTP cyclohydrolase II [Bacteroidetes bacterium RIFCSPLOWO2_12_FULL_37_12]
MLSTIESALKDLRKGKMIIVVDDENRENEGDFICPTECITPQKVNFMAKEGRGLICISLAEKRCTELNLNAMVENNTALHNTSFTVSVDFKHEGTTTGISAHDRAKTILKLIDQKSKPQDFGRPGHIFPLMAKDGGVLRRSGHTEASMDLARMAGFYPSGVLVEIMKEDGSMARLNDLKKIAKRFSLKIISIKDLISYRLSKENQITREVSVKLPTIFGEFELVAYSHNLTGALHIALVKGKWKTNSPVLVRVHSCCLTGDLLGSLRCDCREQLHASLRMVEKEGKGVVLYMNQEGRGIGLLNKLKAYKLQEDGYDTVQANLKLGFKMDERDFGVGAQILRDLNIRKIRLITNNPKKRAGLEGYGIHIIENIPIEIKANRHNLKYLKTKRDKMGHELKLKGSRNRKGG